MNSFEINFKKHQKNMISEINILFEQLHGKSMLYQSMHYSGTAKSNFYRSFIIRNLFEYNDKIAENIKNKIYIAIELIHTYSLICDDLPCMDNDIYRRGRLTNHIIYGENIAIISAESMLIIAFNLLSKLPNTGNLINKVCEKTGHLGMIYGQSLDIKQKNHSISLEKYIEIAKHKTGALFALSFIMPYIILSFDLNFIDKLEEKGYLFGILFQIIDDLDDQDAVIDKKILNQEAQKTIDKLLESNLKNTAIINFIKKFIIYLCKKHSLSFDL
ncbi:MAG: polyprenyl synthetase family protein [Anaplasmataceae bacterium]|nr:polyprenyl synthetase family protein [Anaplasmataceae bacterium]